jgi:hypothetical protein
LQLANPFRHFPSGSNPKQLKSLIEAEGKSGWRHAPARSLANDDEIKDPGATKSAASEAPAARLIGTCRRRRRRAGNHGCRRRFNGGH